MRLAQRPVIGGDEHVAEVTQTRQRDVDRAVERVRVVERRREAFAHLRQKRQTIPGGDRFGVRDPLPFDELGLLPFDPFAVRDVARESSSADDGACVVGNRRDPDGHLDVAAVFAPPQRFERLNPLP
jgi:hypothetical protein